MRLDTKKMRVIRAEKNLSQENVASMAKISQNHYSGIERGNRLPRLDALERIAHALGIEVNDLLISDNKQTF